MRLAEGAAQQIELDQRHKLASLVVAGELALLVVRMFEIEVLGCLGMKGISPMLDRLFTAVV